MTVTPAALASSACTSSCSLLRAFEEIEKAIVSQCNVSLGIPPLLSPPEPCRRSIVE